MLKYALALTLFSISLVMAACQPRSSNLTPRNGIAIQLSKKTLDPISDHGQQMLLQKAIHLLRTSNFNTTEFSRPGGPSLSTHDIHSAYQNAIAGEHLLIRFSQAQEENTIGGKIDVLDIVVGLNNPDVAVLVDSLFSIESSGRIVQHWKYGGMECIDLAAEISKELHR